MHAEDRVWRERGLRAAVLAGDEQAWRTWYEESYDGLHAYVSWRCGHWRDLTDEVVQDTWLTAVRRVRSFDPAQGPFAGWLRGLAANVLRNQLRREGRRNHHVDATAALPAADDAGEAERREQALRVAQALTALPERYEAVLRAKYLDGQAVADIAADWGETAKAVESLLTRARQAFREAYEQQE